MCAPPGDPSAATQDLRASRAHARGQILQGVLHSGWNNAEGGLGGTPSRKACRDELCGSRQEAPGNRNARPLRQLTNQRGPPGPWTPDTLCRDAFSWTKGPEVYFCGRGRASAMPEHVGGVHPSLHPTFTSSPNGLEVAPPGGAERRRQSRGFGVTKGSRGHCPAGRLPRGLHRGLIRALRSHNAESPEENSRESVTPLPLPAAGAP